MSNVRISRQKSGLKSVQMRAASIASSLNPNGSQDSSVGTLILEKVPSKDLEGDFQVSIWANG
jgi:hypothetical protein